MCSASTVVMWVFSVLLFIGIIFSFIGTYRTMTGSFTERMKTMFTPRNVLSNGGAMATWGSAIAFVSLIVCVITGAVSINVREGFKMTYGL